ncbi:trypsin-like peptidase domain-containing protein [Nonomuraea sp. bgisy101]|uniref:trypsin-like peptidase domain-containing protein n=1 Tax=Nonomuraea sp. bgisy101 TaxID=3413784 RepID=UPI003D713F39
MRARLAAATRSVCVALESGDLVGSGVFVGPGEVLTCAHVVSDPDDPVTGRWNERELSLRVAEWLPDLDLALLRCDGEVADLWAGLSAEAEPGDELWAFGFPGGPYRSGDSVSFRYDGPSRLRGRDDLLRVTHGRAMEGFSGAPVLNWRTGGVCGLLRRSDQPAGGPPGARLVPVPVIRSALPSLSTAPGWLGLLDDEQIGAGGWQALGPRVRSYLAAARTEAGRHPYGLGVAFAPRLDTVYVSQQADALAATGPARHLDAASLVDEYGGGLVVGGPGAGKSSLLRHLLALAADDRRVPVLVPAAALAGDLPLPRALAEGVYATLGSSVDDLDLAELLARHAAPGVPWLVLVDGVDELQGQEARARVLRAVARWWRDDRYRFVVTSRPLPQAELSVLHGERFPVVEIQPLADAQLPVLATRWFTALGLDDVPAMVERFMTRLSLGPLARVPLIATMICLVFAESPGNPLPPTRAELYERFVGILLGKAGREGDRRLLTDVALKVITEDADPGDLAPAEMLRRSGLMVERSGGFAFAHRTIAEYLAACRLAERRPGRLARWRIMLGAGRQNSLDLFMAALLKDRGVDLTEPVPHRFLLPRLAHARLVAALAREGVAVRGGTLEAAERTLREVVEGRLQAVPEALREFGWNGPTTVSWPPPRWRC